MMQEDGQTKSESGIFQPSAVREKSVRLAQGRTIKAIKAIRTISKLGKNPTYEYDDSDVRKIAGTLNHEIEALKIRMDPTGTKDTIDFQL
ncbi:MAG: hypothetical protein V6Z86_06365 [Hyphomicrobiales bacterium]